MHVLFKVPKIKPVSKLIRILTYKAQSLLPPPTERRKEKHFFTS